VPETEQDAPDPAEARLVALLALLRMEPARSDPALALAIVRRARWEWRVRHATQTLAGFAAALGGGLLIAVRRTPSAPRP